MNRHKSEVRLQAAAENDLAEIIEFIAAESPPAASALLDRFEKAFATLGEHPRSGRVPEDAELIGLGYRYLVVENYLVFYVVTPGVVMVRRIIHGARDYRGSI